MKRFTCLPLVLLGTLLSAGAGAAAADLPAPAAAMKVHDLASGFTAVFDRNAGKPDQEFIQDFKASVASRLPGFYGAGRLTASAARPSAT
ncbi:hypothetical protein IM543_05225 [Massilia sp. UMI-21]|nr:hypothetical protein IM543_05225 [Massilia sp. UMI-21]